MVVQRPSMATCVAAALISVTLASASVEFGGAARAATVTTTSSTFNLANCTSAQQYVVPGDVSVVKISAGGGGGETAHTPTGNAHGGGVGGQPGFVAATVPVTPGQTLYIGSAPGGYSGPLDNGYAGGIGGASTYVTTDPSAGCNRVSVSSIIVAAAGGGGGGGGGAFAPGGTGGSGGLPYGGDGNGGGGGGRDGSSHTAGAGGFGANQNGPGAGGAPGNRGCGNHDPYATAGGAGTSMVGGDGGYECFDRTLSGGGGGAGYYGGGGGGGEAGDGAGGGGGGYSYAEPAAKAISYPTTGTPMSVTITPVTLGLSVSASPVSPAAYDSVITLTATFLKSTADSVNGVVTFRTSGAHVSNRVLGVANIQVNDAGTAYFAPLRVNTKNMAVGDNQVVAYWSDPDGLFPNMTASMTFNVTPPPPPTCQGASLQTVMGSAVSAPLACSSSITEPLTPTVISAPAHGSLSAVSGGSVTYTPAAGFAGTDGFIYQTTGLGGPSAPATVSISVAAAPTVALTSPVDGAVYERGTPLTAHYSCTAGDFGGVLATTGGCVGTTADGASLDTSTTGVRTFVVTSSDGAASPNITTRSATYTIRDTIAPDTTLTSGPTAAAATTQQGASFTYQGTAGDTASFECQLDAGAYAACPSAGMTYSNLADGTHTFSVRAIDGSGNVDPTPATRSWTVDTTAPTITITSPAAQGTYVVGQGVMVGFSCSDGVTGSGVATCTGTLATGAALPTTDPGTRTFVVTATDRLGNSSSSTVTYVVNPAATTTTLTSSMNPSVSGQSVTYTAKVTPQAPGTGTPAGTVAFKDGATVITGCGAVALDSTGTARCSAAYATPASHAITATYGGTTRYTGSPGALTQTVAKAPVVVTAAPVGKGLLTYTYAATIRRGFDGAPLAGKKVSFAVGKGQVCSATTDANGRASCSVIGLVIGYTTYTASFAGDSTYLAGSGTGNF